MTGEELNRKYWESQGWRVFGVGIHAELIPPDFVLDAEVEEFGRRNGKVQEPFMEMPEKLSRQLPLLHLDANLAIAEACKQWPQTRDGWLLESHQGETRLMANEEHVTVHGEGPSAICEAILKALIAAGEK